MKKYAIFSAFLLFAFIGSANAIMYDFNSLPAGNYSESDFSNLFDGVYFDNNGGSFSIGRWSFPGMGLPGPGSDLYINDIYGGLRQEIIRFEPYRSTIATFDNLTDYVSITRLCDAPHSVWFFMRVFDTDHSLLAQFETIYSPTVTQEGVNFKSYTLSYQSSFADIASIEFWSDDGNWTQGDGYWDNFCFNGQPIPEPNTIILLGTGLIGLAFASFRKPKN